MLNQDYKEFFELLNVNKVRYLLIGGYAVSFYGQPRFTKDLDIWVDSEKKNAENLIKALNQFGFESLGLTVMDFLVQDQIVQLGYPPERIDLLTSLEGVAFKECYKARTITKFDEVKVDLISLEDLKKNKKACGRAQDIADLENLP